MIGRTKIKKDKLLFLRPFLEHSVAPDMIRGLDTQKYDISSLNYNEKYCSEDIPTAAKKIHHRYTSILSESITPTLFFINEQAQLQQLLQLAQTKQFDLIIPTKARYVRLLSEKKSLFGDKVFVPDLDVVKLCTDKDKTYEFFGRGPSPIPVPDYAPLQGCDVILMNDILKKKGARFVKPATSSGGAKASFVHSLDDFVQEYGDNQSKLVVSEILNRPEFNHTIVVQYGEPVVQATYECLSSQVGVSRENMTVIDYHLHLLGERIIEYLQRSFGEKAVNGVYNIDFLLNDEGNPVLSEINVGRLPGGNAIFNFAGQNVADQTIQAALGHLPSSKTSYEPNIIHNRTTDTLRKYILQEATRKLA